MAMPMCVTEHEVICNVAIYQGAEGGKKPKTKNKNKIVMWPFFIKKLQNTSNTSETHGKGSPPILIPLVFSHFKINE